MSTTTKAQHATTLPPQFGTLTANRKPSKVELIDSAGDRIAVVPFSNYDYDNNGALALERAGSIALACNSRAALIAAMELCVAELSAYDAPRDSLHPHNVALAAASAALKQARGE
jgi:hypothetical protein